MNGGGTIFLFGMDQPTRIRSANLGFIFCDEGIEFTEEEYLELLGRLRCNVGSRQIVTATNPSTPSHFLYKRFFLNKNINRKVIIARTEDNHFLPKDYIENLRELPEIQRKRYLEGLWCATDRAIYDTFNRNIHVKNVNNIQFEDYLIGVDAGYTHPAGVILAGLSGSRLYILKEWKKSKQLLDRITEVVKEFAKDLQITPTILVDPSAPTLKAEIENAGFRCEKTNNDVLGGINRIRNRLEVRNDSSDLIINHTCTQLISEMENYQFQEGTEKPVKVNDELVDIIRYITNHIDDQRPIYIHPYIDRSLEEEDDDGFVALDGFQEE
jgi:PBSX family phage terminase large subunit